MTRYELLLRGVCYAGQLTFADIIQRVHNTVAEALAHADVPQIRVIAELARKQKLLPFDVAPYQVALCAL